MAGGSENTFPSVKACARAPLCRRSCACAPDGGTRAFVHAPKVAIEPAELGGEGVCQLAGNQIESKPSSRSAANGAPGQEVRV